MDEFGVMSVIYAYTFGIITYMLYHEWRKRRSWMYRWDHISVGMNGLIKEMEKLREQWSRDS